MWQLGGFEIFFMVAFDGLEVSEKGLFEACGQHRIAIPAAHAGSDHDLVPREVDILDSEAATLHQPQACPIEKHSHQPRRALKAAQEPLDLLFGQDDR